MNSDDLKPLKRLSSKKTRKYRSRGLGDIVHAVANPVAKAIDKVVGTDIQHCSGCSARRRRWNKRFPMGS